MVLLWKEMKRNSTSGLHQHPLVLQSRHLGESISIHFRFIRIDTKHWGPWHTAQQQHLSEWCLQSHMLLGVAIWQLKCTSGWHVSIVSPTNFSYCKHQTKHPITEKLKNLIQYPQQKTSMEIDTSERSKLLRILRFMPSRSTSMPKAQSPEGIRNPCTRDLHLFKMLTESFFEDLNNPQALHWGCLWVMGSYHPKPILESPWRQPTPFSIRL